MDYKSSGVDIEAGNAFVDSIKDSVKSTHRPEVVGGLGGFNGMMKIPEKYKRPVLVSGADGVGTKLNIAQIWDKHYNVGIDLVAMCVNDVITCGAEPLYFLDYIAIGKLESEKLKEIVQGVVNGCVISGCTLLGGETAEMPSMYDSLKYDLAGFCTGVVEEDQIIDGSKIKEGDKIIGIASSGIHSNGFSLINDMLWRQKIAFADMPELATPTRIYAPLIRYLAKKIPILGMAHITGGGLPENLPRCLPKGLKPLIDWNSWEIPDLFNKIMLAGDISKEEMWRVFNMGIGYCVVVSKEHVNDAMSLIGNDCWTIGEVVV
jgi:phosphoribosylformylglycinamidine cyclo-ligase